MNSKKPGVTILELILKLLIIVTVIGIAGFMLTKSNKELNDSDVKSTLQIEGQKIQEKISDIGIQASDIEIVFPDKQSGEIDYIIIKSYVENDGFPRYFKIQKRGKKLIVAKDMSISFSNSSNNEIISENIDKLSITKNLNNKSIDFDINLKKSKGFIDAVNYEINFTMYFTN
jgi:hypothetical protein